MILSLPGLDSSNDMPQGKRLGIMSKLKQNLQEVIEKQ